MGQRHRILGGLALAIGVGVLVVTASGRAHLSQPSQGYVLGTLLIVGGVVQFARRTQ